MQVIVDTCDCIPPLMAKYLQWDTPLVVVGTPLDIRNFKTEVMQSEATYGWQLVESTIYDVGVSHSVHTMASRTVLFATPTKFKKKVPPFALVD